MTVQRLVETDNMLNNNLSIIYRTHEQFINALRLKYTF